MKIFSYFPLCLFLPFFVAKCNGQDCSLIQRIFDDAKRISTSQRDIDQIIFDNGLVSTFSDDPTWITFGEYPVDSIFVKQMQQSQDLLNFLRLLQERFPDSWQNLTSCISATDRCPQRPEYTCGRERSLDGTCNNLQQPTMGASYTSYTRMFSSYFVDGIDNVRRSKFLNNELPSPRHISNEIYAEQERRAARKLFPFVGSTQEENICNGKPSYSQPINSPWKYQPRQYTFSFLGYMFGQLIAVDTANRIITKGPDRTAPSLQCCRNPVASRNGMGREIANPACLPLTYPANDPFFSRFNVTCGNFVRAATLIPFDCSLKTAEYGNSPTSYADLSGIYGIDQLTLDGLRERKGGRLLTNEHDVLPLDPNSPPQAPYGAGDFRLNQSPVLALWHSLMYRHHNFICEYLESQNPTWNDDELFNACRRLNIAIYQHILFNEYLPLFLKEDYSSRFGIRCDRTKSPDCDKYRSDIDSAIIIEFTQAAGRGLHACSPDFVYMVSEDRKIEQKIPFSDTLGVTNVLDHQYNSILRGAICQPIQCTNISYSNEIRNRMFKLNANGPGFDLFSIDINRARENGLPPYHELFTKCTGIKVRSWNDLLRHFDVENVALMARIYESVFDMDTLAGVLMERRDFSLMGVVARCMTAEQFRNIKYGDRYFYSFSDSPTKFSKDRTAPSLQCCRNPVASRNGMGREIANPACLPLTYPANDPFFSRFNVTCGNFVRAATLIPFDCSLKTAEYGNSPTSYADLSGIYGIDQLTLDGLRERKGGRLLTNEHDVLPLDPNSPPQAPYGAGDFRLNQSPVLALWHSLMYRHHNFICEYLESQNPTWNDDELFNACRRLNIAIYQHILFNEYLPLFLKEDYSSRFGIRCDRTKSPDCDKYRSDIDSAIIIEFTQAAGRGLHACSPDFVYMVSEDRKIEQKIPFSDTLGVTNVLDHQYNSILRGAICQPIQCTNISYSNEIRNRMFKLNANGPGFDLFSIDINRARENGLPPYHELFTKCTGIKVRSWNDLLRHFDVENVALMARIYESVFDMDTLAGVLMERRDFSLMGVVARCMTAEQFRNIKYGDRYFYSFSDSPTKFSKAQINEIETMSIAKLLCQVTDLESVPQHAFLVESAQNPNILCKTYRDFDFSLWKGTPA